MTAGILWGGIFIFLVAVFLNEKNNYMDQGYLIEPLLNSFAQNIEFQKIAHKDRYITTRLNNQSKSIFYNILNIIF